MTEKLSKIFPSNSLNAQFLPHFQNVASDSLPKCRIRFEQNPQPVEREPIITRGSSIKLVVEVISTNWQDDYARKVEEYALLGIPEYWIVDHRGLGGVAFIGKPKQPTFTVCQLVVEEYRQQQYRLGEAIVSPLLPDLQLRLDDLLPR